MNNQGREAPETMPSDDWFEDYVEDEDGFEIEEYDLTSTPNDFNITTIFHFIESGAVRIPGFQRNFVWDQARASKLIESLMLGLPVPQLFLYEEERNRFQVIDGQQRLMSIYYFTKGRFPLPERRVELRTIFDRHGSIPESILDDDEYFTDFGLKLPRRYQQRPSPFQGLTFSTLGQYELQFKLRPLRIVVIKQNAPKDDDSAVYEIFNRLNTGGINLRPQEIRGSMYHSPFYDLLARLNTEDQWRILLGAEAPDVRMKDVEIMLRAFALLIDGVNYAPSMVRFLNEFSRKSRSNTNEQNAYLEKLFTGFLESSRSLPPDVFINPSTRRFSVALFESSFSAACKAALAARSTEVRQLSPEGIRRLQANPEFVAATQSKTTDTSNVRKRLALAEAFLTETS